MIRAPDCAKRLSTGKLMSYLQRAQNVLRSTLARTCSNSNQVLLLRPNAAMQNIADACSGTSRAVLEVKCARWEGSVPVRLNMRFGWCGRSSTVRTNSVNLGPLQGSDDEPAQQSSDPLPDSANSVKPRLVKIQSVVATSRSAVTRLFQR